MRSAAFALLLVGGIFILYGRVISYSFIHEDWDLVGYFANHSPGTVLAEMWSPFGKLLFRPVSQIYLYLLYVLFGLHAAGYHCAAILLHCATSLLVVNIMRSLASDTVVGWGIGFMYGFALSIHIETLTWCVGIYDVLGAFFFFLTIALFLKGSNFSLLVYALALFTKESCVVIPFALLLMRRAVNRTGIRKDLEDLLPFAVVLALFAALRMYVYSSMYLGGSGYAMSVAGGHVIRNLYSYGRWLIQSILPVLTVPGLFLLLILIALAAIAIFSPNERKPIGYTFLWVLVALSPVLFLTIRSSRYYASYALAPFLLLIVRAASMVTVRRFFFIPVLICIVCLEFLFSWNFLSDLAQGTAKADGFWFGSSENIVRKGELIRAFEAGMHRDFPTLPSGSILVFDSVSPSVLSSFRYSTAPRLWYHDSTITVYPRENLGHDSSGYYFYGSMQRLPEEKTIVLTFHNSRLIREER